jgi:hypothetical protein
MQNDSKITYLPLDEYRYRSMLEHLTWLGNRQGWREYVEHKAKQYARFDAELYGTLPTDLGKQLMEKS